MAGPGVATQSRTQLMDLSVGLVEDVRRDGVRRSIGPEDFSAQFQVCLPYRGMFVWHVGHEEVVGDANQVLFVTGGEGYRVSGPFTDGYAELIITPDYRVLSEMMHATGAYLSAHPLFRCRSRWAHPELQSLRAQFLHWATGASDVEELEAEDLVLSLLRSALQDRGLRNGASGPTTKRLIRRAKEFLQAELPKRIRL